MQKGEKICHKKIIAIDEIREFLWNIAFEFASESLNNIALRTIEKLRQIGTDRWITFRGNKITASSVPPFYDRLFSLLLNYCQTNKQNVQEQLQQDMLKVLLLNPAPFLYIKQFHEDVYNIENKNAPSVVEFDSNTTSDMLVRMIETEFYSRLKLLIQKQDVIPPEDIKSREPYLYFSTKVVAFEFLCDESQRPQAKIQSLSLTKKNNKIIIVTKENCPKQYKNMLEKLFIAKRAMCHYQIRQKLLVHSSWMKLATLIFLDNPQNTNLHVHDDFFQVKQILDPIRSEITEVAMQVSQLPTFARQTEALFQTF